MTKSVRATPSSTPMISQETIESARRLSRLADDSKELLASLRASSDSLRTAPESSMYAIPRETPLSFEDSVSARTLGTLEAQCELLDDFMAEFKGFSDAVERERERSASSERLSKVVAVLSLLVAIVSLLGQFGFFGWLTSAIGA